MTSKKVCKKSLSNLNWLHYVFTDSILNCTCILTLHLIKNETKQICETIRSTVQQTLHRDLGEGGGSIRHNMLCRTLDLNLSEFFFKTDQLLGSLTSGMSPPNVVKMMTLVQISCPCFFHVTFGVMNHPLYRKGRNCGSDQSDCRRLAHLLTY